MFKTIYSLDNMTKKNISFKKVDIIGTKDLISLLKLFTNDKVIIAKKDVSVYATAVVYGDEVDTRTRFSLNGLSYTFEKDKRVITEKDEATNARVLSYTDGEERVIKGELFKNLYTLENKNWELYKPSDTEKRFVTVTKNVYFKTLWGEIVFAPEGSKLCVEHLFTRDLFVVMNSFFKVAYSIVGQAGTLDDLKVK